MKCLGTIHIYHSSEDGFRLVVDTDDLYEGLEGIGDTLLEAFEDLVAGVETVDGIKGR